MGQNHMLLRVSTSGIDPAVLGLSVCLKGPCGTVPTVSRQESCFLWTPRLLFLKIKQPWSRNNYSLWGHRNTGWGCRRRLFHLLAVLQSHQRRIPVRVVVWVVWGYWQAAGSLRIRGYLQAHLKTESWGRWTDSQHKPPQISSHSKNSCGTTLCSVSARCPLCP